MLLASGNKTTLYELDPGKQLLIDAYHIKHSFAVGVAQRGNCSTLTT